MKKIAKIISILFILILLFHSYCYGAQSKYEQDLVNYIKNERNEILEGAGNDNIDLAKALYESDYNFWKEQVVNWCVENNITVRPLESYGADFIDSQGNVLSLDDVFAGIDAQISDEYIRQEIPGSDKNNVILSTRQSIEQTFTDEGFGNGTQLTIFVQEVYDDVIALTPNNPTPDENQGDGQQENNQGNSQPNNNSGINRPDNAPNGYQDPNMQTNAGVWADLKAFFEKYFSKPFDALAGMALYPIKIIILTLAGIFDLIIGGIANIGGVGKNGLGISLQDIIFTTETNSPDGVPIVAIDFFNISSGTTYEISTIREGIASWFLVLRNLSIVISLCVLIYTGIRMAITTIADDKAKYKKMLTNWVVQMVLIFLMHYIIVLTLGINTSIVEALRTGTDAHNVNYMNQLYQQAFGITLTVGFGSALAYCVLLGMTFSFLITYIKRMMSIGFLIVISPLVTVTYAIDKMGDSKSQALNTWLKEFVYNVLIQPFHCIIYSIFVSTAMSFLSSQNIGNIGAPIFAILCIMFMSKAEDILRKIFAFDKNAKSLGSGFASVAMLGAGLSTVSSMFKKEESKSEESQKPMPDMVAMRQNDSVQNVKKQEDEVIEKANQSTQESIGTGITRTAKQIQKDRRRNRAIESWQNSGGMAGLAAKTGKTMAKTSLPVLSAMLGAGQGNFKAVATGAMTGHAISQGIERGIEKQIEKKSKLTPVEMSRQAKANEKVFEEVYKEQEQKWTRKRWKMG